MVTIIEKAEKLFHLLWNIAVESLTPTQVVKMSTYFDRGGNIIKKNWGDDINYWFLREISEKKIIPYDWALLTKWLHKPYVAGIGSILTLFNMDNAIVWGSGIISSNGKITGKPKEIRAVRGPLTRKLLLEQGFKCPEVYGDPALLISSYYRPTAEKKYKLGVIPHYTDWNNPLLAKLKEDEDVLMIDIKHYNHWLDFIDQICQCEVIASSSLHGLIMSCAYGIPNVWIKLKDSKLSDDFKHHDFFLSLKEDREVFLINTNVQKEELIAHCKMMPIQHFDKKKLIEACPFELKNIRI